MSSSINTSSGSVKKSVVCEHCGHRYEYEMKRVGVGTVHGSSATKAEADAEAMRIAADKLRQMLETDCDVVPCPDCGAITRQMDKARKAFFPKMFMVIGAGLGMLGLVFVGWLLTARIFLFPSVVGIGFVLLGTFVLLTKSKEMLMAGRSRRSTR
jgi:uncharacterized protein (DUF983 family)